MAGTTAVAMGSNGRAVVIKRGPAQRLRREVAMLRLAARPGVVELVEPGPDADPVADGVAEGEAEVTTVFVGGGTLAERLDGQLDDQLVAVVASSVAATMAQLHDRGIVHGRLSPDHILVADGNAVVCGLAEAVVVSESEHSPAGDDVVALARLLDEMASRCTGGIATGLRQVARRTLAGTPDARPSMRSLAAALAALPHEGAPTAPPSPRLLPPRGAGKPRRRALAKPRLMASAALVAAVLAAVAMSFAVSGGDGDAAVSAPATAPSPTVPRSSTTTSAPPPRRLWPRPACPGAPTPMGADLDGDGCDEEVEVADGIVSSAGRRWRVADPDDVVTLGDWDCDGVATPAVLRGGSGQLWVYPRWAESDDEVSATLAGVVPGATSAHTLQPSAGTGSCDRIEVVHPDDRTTIVTPRR
jgi:tRNA A-37 threonylcarbamoyl transferase component Bud32